MSVAGPNPNITRKHWSQVSTLKCQRLEEIVKSSVWLNSGGLGKETLKVYCTVFPFLMLSCQRGF